MALVIVISDTDPLSDHNHFRFLQGIKGLAAEQDRLLRARQRGKANAESKPRQENKLRGRQQSRLWELTPTVFPQGIPVDTRNKEVLRAFAREFEKRGWEPPDRKTVRRFLEEYSRLS